MDAIETPAAAGMHVEMHHKVISILEVESRFRALLIADVNLDLK